MGNANNPSVRSSIIENQKQSTNALAAFIRKEFEKFEALINPERWIDKQLVRIARKKQSWRFVLIYTVVVFGVGAAIGQAFLCGSPA